MIPDPEKEPVEGMYFGGDTKFDPWSEARGRLTAFDAATGKQKWSYTASKPVIGGVAASGGDLQFAGELSGDFRVFDGRDGKILYTRNVGGPIAGELVSYEAAGHQRVAVVSGFVGIYNKIAPDLGGSNPTITVFALKR